MCLSGSVWFRGKDIANALGYENTTKAIRDHVEDEDKRKMDELVENETFSSTYHDKITICINES